MLRARIKNSIRSYPLKPSGGTPPFSFGNALQFDGTDDFVSFTAIDETELTISFWFKQTTKDGFFRYFFSSGLGGADGEGLRITNGNLSYYDGSGATTLYNIADTEVYNHIVITRNTSTKLLQCYVNGVAQYSSTNANISTGRISRLGTLISSNYINGTLDEIAVWNTALSPTDIANLYNSGNGDYATNYSPENLIAYWRCNEEDGATTLVDETGNYNGTLNNFSTPPAYFIPHT